MRSFAVVRIEPVSARRVFAHVNTRDPRTHGFQWIDMPTYPAADEARGRALREARIAADMGLRAAAAALGIKAVDLSAVEQGAGRFVRDEAYAEAAALWRLP